MSPARAIRLHPRVRICTSDPAPSPFPTSVHSPFLKSSLARKQPADGSHLPLTGSGPPRAPRRPSSTLLLSLVFRKATPRRVLAAGAGSQRTHLNLSGFPPSILHQCTRAQQGWPTLPKHAPKACTFPSSTAALAVSVAVDKGAAPHLLVLVAAG